MATVAEIGTADVQRRTESVVGTFGGEHRASNATRYMCAGAYLDPTFRKEVIARLEDEPFKAVGPNYGCDLGVVLTHCLRARRLARNRDACLTLILLAPLLLPAFRDSLSYLFTEPDFLGHLAWLLEDHAGMLVLAFASAVAVVFVEQCVTRFRVLRRELSKAGFADHNRVAPAATACLPREIAGGQAHNLIVYGGFTPFVGAGTTIGGWSFAVRTDKGREDVGRVPQPFHVDALYERVASDIEALALPNLRIQPRLYVDGRSVRDDRRLLPEVLGRPRHHLDAATLLGMRDQHGGSARWYQAVEITDWSGELVLTIFIRLQQLPKTLFVEANYALLTPLKQPFYEVDEQDFEPRPSTLAEQLIKAAVLTLWRWPTSIFRTAALLWGPFRAFREHRARMRAVKRNPGHNYGAATSLRENSADQRYRVYFQRLDQEMHLKTVEKQLLDALVEFLDEHDIDTSSLKERETTILNNGVMISGGSLQAESLAVGDKAKAATSRFQGPVKVGQNQKAA